MKSESLKNSKVLVTGHTGFKGSWLTQILDILGAEVFGISLPNEPDTLFEKFNIPKDDHFHHENINDFESILGVFKKIEPEIVFHLAAQPLVLHSYSQPIETFQTNVIGTANVLEACRQVASVRIIVVVTTDKVYKNTDLPGGYTEDSPLGGSDPYSASKSASEMVVNAWRELEWKRQSRPAICTVRAGNVIGGGDYSADRLLPDLIQAFKLEAPPLIRNPNFIRPWQHVLEPLFGYVKLAEKMSLGGVTADSYNFGPNASATTTVLEVAKIARDEWPSNLEFAQPKSKAIFSESSALKLNSESAFKDLGWKCRLTVKEAVKLTLVWEKDIKNSSPLEVTRSQILDYMERLI